MERLTRKTNGKDYCSYCHQVEFENEIFERKDDIIEPQDFYNKYPYQSIGNEEEILNKLGTIEDLQEELGIDLITLEKALKYGVYTIHSNGEKRIPCLAYNGAVGYILDFKYEQEAQYILNDYGKTWWLEKPKEELEND